MARSRRAVRCRPPSVPSRPSMYARISGARRSGLRSRLTRARVTPCRRASAAAFLIAPVSISRRHSRARVRASMIRGRLARAARARGPQPPRMARSEIPQCLQVLLGGTQRRLALGHWTRGRRRGARTKARAAAETAAGRRHGAAQDDRAVSRCPEGESRSPSRAERPRVLRGLSWLPGRKRSRFVRSEATRGRMSRPVLPRVIYCKS